MQDTPCDFSSSPSPAPSTSPSQEMSTNTVPSPSLRIMNPAEEESIVATNTKEDYHTKDIDCISQERTIDLVQSNIDIEKEHKEIGSNNLKESVINKEDIHYVCEICDAILFSSHDFTIHIRSHKDFLTFSATEKGYFCRLCNKVISFTSSLKRHILTHSAHRPFICKVCGLSFTNNQHLYKHMKNHRAKNCDSFSYDSDASSESFGSVHTESSAPLVLHVKKRSRTSSEFNNNDIELTSSNSESTKRKSDTDDTYTTRKRKCDNKKYFLDKFDCTLCDKTGFLSLNLLETHMEECHPKHKAKCDPCNLVFKNHRVLNLHRDMAHHKNQHSILNRKQATIGFKDLTFVDFSSQKFPHIARAVCEQSLHHASSMYHRYQCEKCDRAFPCESALKIHQQSCGQDNYASSGESWHQDNDLSSSDNEAAPTDLSAVGKKCMWNDTKMSDSSDEADGNRKRDTFFAGLDLQNKSTLNISDQDISHVNERFRNNSIFKVNNSECKDLADIQSIISVASVGGLLHDLSKSPQPSVLEVTPPDSGSRATIYDSVVTDEEDCFAAEFRKMKLRGEFPCRLCTAVFPNLRALKGHNRVHLTTNGGPNGEPYRCNMCKHSSSDKAALVRHMRTHNGDRPYECELCHYAFTTKANCERHLRNRHAKMTREDVKKSILYHPSEDHTNEVELPTNPTKPSRDGVKRTLFSENELKMPQENKEFLKGEKIPHLQKSLEQIPDIYESIHTHIPSAFKHVPSAFKKIKDVTFTHIGIPKEVNHRNSLDAATMTYKEYDSIGSFPYDESVKSEGEDLPLDLTMDVLDLSKKKRKKTENVCNINKSSESENEAKPQDLSKKSVLPPEKFCSYPLKSDTTLETSHHIPQIMPLGFSQTASPTHLFGSESPSPANQAAMPQLDLLKFYPAKAHQFYLNNNSFPHFSSTNTIQQTPFSPYFVPPPPPVIYSASGNHELVEIKERLQKELIRGLQFPSGGSLVFDQIAVANAAERIKSLHQQVIEDFNQRAETSKDELKIYSPSLNKEVKPTSHVDEKQKQNSELNHKDLSEKLPPLKPKQETSNSVKMVIKNGMLIPKQKQRRYRTERPFSCEHCSARFTLRSNMERHIKQQHPQFWSQRQRSVSNIPVKRNNAAPSKPQQNLFNPGHFSSPSIYNFKSEDELSRTSMTSDRNNTESKLSFVEGKSCISKEVKNAISQQLKSKSAAPDTNIEENNEDALDEDAFLVIDEEVKDKETKIKAENMRENLSHNEEIQDLASVPKLINNLDTASTTTFRQYFQSDEDNHCEEGSEEDEEGLVAGESTTEGCNSGSDENRSEPEDSNGTNPTTVKKKSAYSSAPNRVTCNVCFREFPWSSSLNRHILTHTGQRPYKCPVCYSLFTTKSNCDRHLLRKHGGRRIRTSTPESQHANDATSNNSSAPNYTMRNVPERPYKCKNCPSSTFSTLSNLKKHLSTKHSTSRSVKTEGTQSGYESQGSISEEIDVGENEQCKVDVKKDKINISDLREIHPGHSSGTSFIKTNPLPVEHNFVVTPSDLPFKCHLCEGSFSDRQEALDHIRDNHCAEFQMLVSKGALETGAMTEDTHGAEEAGEESVETLRGKFPDYANRKVMCAFCLRRFWSAEDLRRHMRTHTGERPFSCDICRRRFTLKHSMLRHRKKHSFPHNSATGDTSPRSDEDVHTSNHNNTTNKPWTKSRGDDESDLISNLLGIQDKTIVDKMLMTKSADDAAKLLGVQK